MTPGPAPTRRLVLAAAGTLLLPRAARAQMAKRRRIAYLSPGLRVSVSSGPYLGAFRQGLRALGYADEDIAIEIRYADGHLERLPDLAAELVHLAPEVIVADSPQAIQAAKQATSTIPIVMAGSGDPVAAGFVASLAHPGGNVTGLSTVSSEMAGKWLQLLKTAIPGAERIAFLVNPGNPQHVPLLQVARQAARTLRTEILPVEARAADEIDGAFATMTHEHAEALIVARDPVFFSERSRIVELAAGHNLPAIYGFGEFAAIGGLMSYGPDQNDLIRRAATYVDKILKGAKPADLPVEQPTRFRLVVNLKTAQALGLTIPPVIVAGADEVIE
jgi:putative tryptophan/tyrosine transport system substrate-binding protein